MFQCSHNKKAVKENHSFNNLFDKFKERINIDNFNIWCIKNESNKFNNEKLYCEKCRINLGNYDEINHYIFYKFNIFKISIDIFKQNENNKIIKISNFFAEKYLNLLFGYAIENNIISMLIYSETIGIRFKFINNSIGIIKISNLISNNVEIISKEFFLIYYTIINGLDIENDNYKTELKINITMQDIFSLYKIIESNKIQFKKEILFYKINTQNIKNEENIYIYKL